MLTIPAFNEENALTRAENRYSTSTVIPSAGESDFEKYIAYLCENGYSVAEARSLRARRFAACRSGSDAVFLNWYSGTGELYIVTEKECKYFDFRDTPPTKRTKPTMSQLYLEDFGMSYVIRLSDGRFIVIDGGWDFEPDADTLFRNLKSQAEGGEIVIASWIFTHAHCDHFHCFIPFFDKYSERVRIERFMYCFPEHNDLERYPGLYHIDARVGACSGVTFIPRMEERVAKSGAEVYKIHTGQTYQLGDARIEFLSGLDDTVNFSDNLNTTSLVFRMELGGQIILFTGDASFSDARLAERYGDYLRADILQVPHHGFGSGRAAGEIAGYDLVKPETCFVPCSNYNAYNSFGLVRAGTRHVMTNLGIGELITGEHTRTVTLPYHPPRYARAKVERAVKMGYESFGANTWVFSELNSSDPEDFVFTIVNPCNANVTVWAELIFDTMAKKVNSIKIEVARQTLKKLSLIGEGADPDALFFNGESLVRRGVPEDCDMAVRFIADVPVVISNKKHSPAYHSGASFME